ncbi:hypothetical protein ABIB38_003585 [Massilia sp. UYP11]|uniref:cohesin domain-containing protein n=1 Tax=Massilia sp. UYP11 TaxID=1756385 RepID=UPI003D1BBF75
MASVLSRIIRTATALLACAVALAAPAGAAVLTTSLSSPAVTVGQQFSLDVMVGDLAPGQALAGFDLDLVFDPALVAPVRAEFGHYLGEVDVDQLTHALFGAGRADFAAVSLLDGTTLIGLQPGTFPLARLVFTALAPGAVSIDFDLLAAPGLLLSDGFGEAIAVSAVHGAVVDIGTATSVPEPSTLALFMLGAVLAPGGIPLIRGRRAAL